MTNDQLGKALVAAGLMPVAEVKSLWAAIPAEQRPKDAKSFAELLIEQGKLTKFQATELLSGTNTPLILGDYQLLAKIGAGGMGQVFKAQHRHMKRTVAIKLLPAELTKDEAAIKRFQREVEAAAKLSHPNIVQAYDASTQRGVWYLVMEYVEGRDLAGIVAAEGSLPIPRAVNYIRQSARGLGFAHESGVVHRDIKPANLLLDKKGTIKILDMGLARFDDGAAQEGLTQSGQVMGTVDYMAPEQAFDTRHADARADVYSLGCTLFRLLTAQNMYEGESLVQKLMGHQSKPIPKLSKYRSDVPPQLEAIFERMVAKDPKERYQTMAEVLAALAPFEDPKTAGDTGGLTAHFEGIGSTATNAALLAQPTAAHVAVGEVMPTISLNNPMQSTDPVSARSIQLVRDATPQPGAIKRPPGNRKKLLIAAGGLGGVLAVLLGIWVIIKDKDGNEVARVQVPEGGTATIQAPATGVPANGQTTTTNIILAPRFALQFDGKSSVETPDIPWGGLSEYTVEAWARAEDDGSTDGILVDRYKSAALARWQGRWQLTVKYAGEQVPAYAAQPAAKATGEWEHLAGVVKDGVAHLYINGKHIRSTTLTKPLDLGQGQKLSLGTKLKASLRGVRYSKTARYTSDFTPPENFSRDGNTLLLYKFNEGMGEVLNDSSGNNHHGKIVGAKWVKVDGLPIASSPTPTYEIRLHGTAPNIIVDSLKSDCAKTLTVEAYVTPLGNMVGTSWILGWPNSNLAINSYNGNDFRLAYPPRHDLVAIRFPQPKRFHVAAIVDGQEARLYRDGELLKKVPLPTDSKPIKIVPFVFGGPENYSVFDGVISEVRVSKVARYDKNFTPAKRFEADADTLALYHCDEGTGDVLRDSSGNNHHGKIVGAKWVKVDAQSTMNGSQSGVKTIPAEALTFNGHRYLLVDKEGNWDQARTNAESLGGHLVTINSKEERDWVRENIIRKRSDSRGMTWMGGVSDNEIWSWISGEPFDKSLWLGTPTESKKGRSHLCWIHEDNWNSQWPHVQLKYHLVEWDTLGPAISTTVLAPPSVAGPPTDLLPLVRVAKPTMSEPWKRDAQGIVIPGNVIPGNDYVRTQIDVAVPEEYELQIDAVPLSGSKSLILGLSRAGKRFWIPISGWNAAHTKLEPLPTTGTGQMESKALRLTENRPVKLVCTVWREGVKLVGDGLTLIDWRGDTTTLQPEWASWALPEPEKLALGSWQGEIRVTRLELRPLLSTNTVPAPPLAKAPFTTAQAKAHQQAWAKHLGMQVETINSIGQKMVLIPPGEFLMGSTDEQVEAALKIAEVLEADPATKDRVSKTERPQHKVVITKPYLMSTTEVTVGQFKRFAAATKYLTEAEKAAPSSASPQPSQTYLNPSYAVTDDFPAAVMTWNDALAYCAWLSEQEKKIYRLPTEAEWEFACRAGTTTQFSFGNDYQEMSKYGWHWANAGGKSHPVATLLPNPFGLFDIHGNLLEWCSDYADDNWYAITSPNDPIGPTTGLRRILRGGYWNNNATLGRSAFRASRSPTDRFFYVGFRVVRELDVPAITASATPPPTIPATTSSKLWMHDPAFPQWVKDVQALPADKQLEAVSKKLMELNPGFDGKLTDYEGSNTTKIENGAVTEIGFFADQVSDISPVQALAGLKKLRCNGSNNTSNGKLSDLSPLQGLALTELELGGNNNLLDLSPLRGMPLTRLYLGRCSRVNDLSSLRGLKLTQFVCFGSQVSDLSPLSGMPLTYLDIGGTPVSDLSPTKGMPLQVLKCVSTPLSDLSPLAGMSLIDLTFTPRNITKELGALRQMKSLKFIRTGWRDNEQFSPEEFWKKYDAGVFSKPTAPDKSWQTPAFQQWIAETQKLSADEQLKAVSKKLVELNPGFDGALHGPYNKPDPTIEAGAVTGLGMHMDQLHDLSPVRALDKLKTLELSSSDKKRKALSDISPLAGMRLTDLIVAHSQVTDLSPLVGMPLTTLNIADTPVADITPLQNSPLSRLFCELTSIKDLRPLLHCKLTLIEGRKNAFDPSSVEAIKQAFPNCIINWDVPAK